MFFKRNFKVMVYGSEMNNVLSKPIEEEEWIDIPRLFDYMNAVMRKANGVGLAAPQIGVFKQFMLIQRGDRSVISLVNPEITRLYGKETEELESCLSIPPSRNECRVPRLEIVDVEASLVQSPHIRRKFTFKGGVARIVQHEMDLLTGTFFIDRVSDRKRKDVLDRFYNWKSMRRAQIRMNEENEHVNTGAFAFSRGQSRVS